MVLHLTVSVFIIIGMLLSVKAKKLNAYASLTGGLLAFFIYIGTGHTGIILLATFFLLGVLATSWKYDEKERLDLHEEGTGKRSSGQVVANAGLAGIVALLGWILPESQALFLLLIAAAFSSATSDTLSSELGNLYGRKYYNILTFKQDAKGLNGVVSVEGTLFGIAGSVIIAAIYVLNVGWSQNFFLIIVAGTLGNFSDSILGGSLERRKILKNNEVNFINTAVAMLVTLLFYFWN